MNLLEELAASQCNQSSMEAVIGPVAFVNDTCFLTRDGQLGLVIAVTGVDIECADAEVIEDHRDRLQSASGVFGPQFRTYQYLLKRKHPGLVAPPCPGSSQAREAIEDRTDFLNAQDLYTFQIYWVILVDPRLEAIAGKTVSAFFLSAGKTTALQVAQCKELLKELETAAESFIRQMESVCPMRALPKIDAFRFLSRLINLDPLTADYYVPTHGFGIDVGLAQSETELHQDGLSQSGYRIEMLTLRKEPLDSADAARAFSGLPCEFILCLEWKRVSHAIASSHIKGLREARANNLNPSNFLSVLGNYFKKDKAPTAKDQVIDPSALESVNRLGKVLVALGNDGRFYGRASLRLCLFSKDPKKLAGAVAKAREAFGPKEGKLFLERMGSFNTWLSMIPGNHRAAVSSQYLWMENTTYADFSQIFTIGQGEPVNEHLHAPALLVATTELGTPYHLNLNVGEASHTIINGATRSGKSFQMNLMLDHFQQYADTQTCIWDKGGSYRQVTAIYHGSYIEMRAEGQAFTINPFSLSRTDDNLQFLYRFTLALFPKDGQDLDALQKASVYESVVAMYSQSSAMRRLSTFVWDLPLDLGRQLLKWIDGGQYANWFDHEHDTVTFAKFQTYDFEGMEEFPEVSRPLMMYLMRRFRQVEKDPNLRHAMKILAVDEAWKFLTTEQSRNEIKDAVKTGAKNNLMVLLATQSVADLEQSGILAQIEDNCPTQLFVAVKPAAAAKMQEVFKLTDKETEILVGLEAKRDLLVKQIGRPTVKLRVQHSEKALARYRFHPHSLKEVIPA